MSKIEIYSSKKIAGISSISIWLSEYSSDKEGRVLVSPELTTAKDVDFNVDRLIEQLNEVREDAKKLMNG